jgi:hypothetical protein
MAHGEVSEVMPAPSHAVFDLIHDYSRRLEWDTLLRAAHLTNGHTEARKGATSICAGRWYLGGIALETIYISFERPTLAAVKMINRPPFFQDWAASIHHEDLSPGESRVTYKFQFTSRPRILRPLLDPIMKWAFLRETRKRLQSLKAHVARQPATSTP